MVALTVVAAVALTVAAVAGRYDIQYNDTRYNDTQYNDTQYNDTYYYDTKQNCNQPNDTQHNYTKHNFTQDKGSQHKIMSYPALRSSILCVVMLYVIYAECRNAVCYLC
jgi:hypothetical protein